MRVVGGSGMKAQCSSDRLSSHLETAPACEMDVRAGETENKAACLRLFLLNCSAGVCSVLRGGQRLGEVCW